MSIIARSRPAVNPTRHAAKPARPFGEGVFTRRMPYSAADLQWNAENSPANRDGYNIVGPADSAIEYAAGCALADARLSAGYPLF